MDIIVTVELADIKVEDDGTRVKKVHRKDEIQITETIGFFTKPSNTIEEIEYALRRIFNKWESQGIT